MLRRFLCLLFVLLLLAVPLAAHADDFALPGLSHDSDAWSETLQKRFPAGGTPVARRNAERQATDALARKDYATAIAALESRVAAGEATGQQFQRSPRLTFAARRPIRTKRCWRPGRHSPARMPERPKSLRCWSWRTPCGRCSATPRRCGRWRRSSNAPPTMPPTSACWRMPSAPAASWCNA